MAKHLARIHGTEEDKVNCPFYFKIGACRHADRCSRLHHKPAFSPTLLIQHLYRHPQATATTTTLQQQQQPPAPLSPQQAEEDFLCFFEDMYMELSKFGRLEGLHVVDNLGDHMIGHVYVKYRDEEEAADALAVLNGRYYDGRPMVVEYSPVTDFREARCRDYDEETCSRGGFCNFLHVKPVPAALIRSLEEDAEEDRRKHEADRRDNRKHHKKRKKDKKESGGGGGGGSSSNNNRSSKRSRRSRSHSDSQDADRGGDDDN